MITFAKHTIEKAEAKTGIHFWTYIKNGTWMLFSYASGILLGILTSFFFAHYLSKAEYGTYKYILSISSIIGAFTLTGMNTAITKAIAEKKEVYMQSIHYQLKWNMYVFIASLLPITFFALSGNKLIALATLIVSFSTVFLTTFNTYSAYLNGKKEFKKLVRYEIYSAFIQASVVIGALFVFNTALMIVAASFATQTLLAFYFHKTLSREIPLTSPHEEDIRDVIRLGKILSFNTIIKILADQADKLAVFIFLGPVELAVYSFAQALPDQIRGVFKIISPVTLPSLAERATHDTPRTFWKYMTYLLFVTLIAVIGYNIFVSLIFKVLFSTYLVSIPFSRVFSLAAIPVVLTIPLVTFFNARGNTQAITTLNTAGAIIEVVLICIGGYYFGIWGIVWSQVASALCTCGIAFFLLKKQELSLN